MMSGYILWKLKALLEIVQGLFEISTMEPLPVCTRTQPTAGLYIVVGVLCQEDKSKNKGLEFRVNICIIQTYSFFQFKVIRSAVPHDFLKMFIHVYFFCRYMFLPFWPSSGGIHNYFWKSSSSMTHVPFQDYKNCCACHLECPVSHFLAA
jgi:hypothetical protein